MSANFPQLVQTVINNSVSNDWNGARNEWEVTGIDEDQTVTSQCVCGQENLRYLYTIENTQNGNILSPIGSQCIKQFNNSQLTDDTNTYRQLFDLIKAVDNHKFIDLKTGNYFSRKLLKYLYNNGAFQDSRYNHWNGHNDYQFLLDMFNKRTPLSDRQSRKVKALIMNDIIPFAKRQI